MPEKEESNSHQKEELRCACSASQSHPSSVSTPRDLLATLAFVTWGEPLSLSLSQIRMGSAETITLEQPCIDCGNNVFELDIGFYYCAECGTRTESTIATDVDLDTVFGDGALYSQRLHRQAPINQEVHSGDDEPRDFGSRPLPDIQTVARAMRERYLMGLQVMLQNQCQVLMETYKVSPIICGMAGPIWLSYLATTGVLQEGWAIAVLANCKDLPAKGSKNKSSTEKVTINKVYRTLRKSIPIYSTLAISFLSCHLAREPVLPTDIIDWAQEAKLPYLSFFIEMDRYIGTAPAACPLKNRTMFRPTRILGSWQLEDVAGKIAEKIGLHLPPVNFYAVARRWLEELSLPMEILPRACRVYEWLLPTELWISANGVVGFPTRVVVMSILIITLRMLYDINGYGTWEKSLNGVADKQAQLEEGCEMDSNMSSEFDTRELLRVLEAVHKDIEVKHDYLQDLDTYLKYYRDVISAGMARDPELQVNRTIKRCWDIYCKNKDTEFDIKPENLNFQHKNIKRKRYNDDATISTCSESSTRLHADTFEIKCPLPKCAVDSSLRGERELDRMRFEMEENWFCYLAPVSRRKSKGYISYTRAKDNFFMYAVHADYYILLRALAKLAKVDMRLLHDSTLELERKLTWIEGKIRTSLNVPKDQSEGGPVERQEFDLD
ncbi:TATA box-binding protein-associated factor RNA polymerase I subunit B [Rhynchospora pubera]|uniref:TATA box-binding protein-associated factor RNA polymerase I subunit B n=1 Tax=Rhynchospora pubera TaxID=906938 RepID=A0AAV8C1A6_9POAL|nr:TATA box-binding protein-associated factor RNA polymerase I subunit B [Rhynchospora pubera]